MTTMKNVDYIFIDEVSMMIEKFYQLFIMIKRSFSHLKFIIVGDFDQLKPVKDTWTGNYKYSGGLYDLCDGNRIQLTICKRSCEKLFNVCKNVDDINISDYPVVEKTNLNIAFTHQTRKRINKEF